MAILPKMHERREFRTLDSLCKDQKSQFHELVRWIAHKKITQKSLQEMIDLSIDQ